MTLTTKHGLLAAAALALAPAPALAQNDVAAQANQITADAQDLANSADALNNKVAPADADRDGDGSRHNDRDGDDDFPWGLLGLLGLAGLLGLKRNDHDRHVHVDRDVHVDTRRDTRPL